MTKIKTILLIASLAIMNSSALADTTSIDIPFTRKRGAASGSIERAPLHLPIEVSFDNATGVLTICAPEDMEGYVYVYNLSGALESSSQTLNVTFTLPKSGVHVISLEGESWTGEGKIVY